MAERSGFFNAQIINGAPDRTYNANDYNDNLALIVPNGVLNSSANDLQVTASGLNLTVAVGRAWINGHWYHNDTPLALAAITPPASGQRIDRVVLRCNENVTGRSINVIYLQGTAATSPEYPAITRNDTIYDLCLADVFISAGATSVTLHDARGDDSVCGWAYSPTTVLEELETLRSYIDSMAGNGRFTFVCSGTNDNIALSQIARVLYGEAAYSAITNTSAKAFIDNIGGETYLSSLNNESQITIDVVGKFGAQMPYSGTGVSSDRYKWLSIGSASLSNRKIIFDFAHCEKMTIACSAKTIVFFGADMYVQNANVYAYSNNANCDIQMFDGANNDGVVLVENGRYSISTTGEAIFAEFGEYVNVNAIVKTTGLIGYCFSPSSGVVIQVIGGTFAAYGDSNHFAAVFEISAANAGILATNVICPTETLTGYTQGWLAELFDGMLSICGLRSTLQINADNTSRYQIYGRISF